MRRGLALGTVLVVATVMGCQSAGWTPFSYSGLSVFGVLPEELYPVTGAGYDAGKRPTTLHVWHAVGSYPTVLAPFGTYTYVLSTANDCGPQGRLASLLAAIKNTLPAASATNLKAPSSINIFLIPLTARSGVDTREEGRHFDYSKTKDICASYEAGSATRIIETILENTGAFDSPPSALSRMLPSTTVGPILISSNVPYEKLTSRSDLLWLDLSATPPDAYAQILEEYKNRVAADPISSADEFRSFSLSFLTFLSKFGEAVHATLAQYKQLTDAVPNN